MPTVVARRDNHKPFWIGCWFCPTCGSIIRLTEDDAPVVKVQSDQRDGDMVEFPCPNCGNCPGDGKMPCTYYSHQVVCPYGSNTTPVPEDRPL